MVVQQIPLTRPTVGEEELRAVERVFKSGMLTEGAETGRFEHEFAEYLGVKHAVATSSGTTALHLALLCLEIGHGDEVIVPDFTFPATGNVVFHVGAKPVLCDIRLDEFQINPDNIEALITDKTKAIIPVSEFGSTADMKPILRIAKEHNLHVIEDACPALGSMRDGQFAGTFGDMGCFSFHPRKPLAIGEGGMLVTNDGELAEKARLLKNHGRTSHWNFSCVGYNYRLSDVQSAIGRAQLRKLERRIHEQRKFASTYNHYLQDMKDLWTVPREPNGCFHTFQSYVLLLNQTSTRLINRLRSEGIEAQIGTNCLHVLPAYLNCKRDSCGNSLKAWQNSVTLPLFEGMTWRQQERVINAVAKNSNGAVFRFQMANIPHNKQ